MRARVLGSSAGGGLPQWNCACANCAAARRGRLPHRTQDSLAVFAREDAAVVCNASPDLARQLEATPSMHPRAATRHTPLAAIVLTNGDLDHVLGLFSLREWQPLAIYATETVRRGLVERNALCATLSRFEGHSRWRVLALDHEVELRDAEDRPTGIVARPFALPGKPPAHLPQGQRSPEDNIGVRLACARTGTSIVYAPNAARTVPELEAACDLLLFDGTFWTSDELVRLGAAPARAEDMAHLPIGGASGSLAQLAGCRARRKIFTHINNTNPILDPSSPERAEISRAGWELAEDGMELVA